MYARVLSLITSPGKRDELCNTIETEISKLVLKRPGFVEHVTLVSEAEPRLVTVISFWRTKSDAEKYSMFLYPEILALLEPMLATRPTVNEFECYSISGRLERKMKKAFHRASATAPSSKNSDSVVE